MFGYSTTLKLRIPLTTDNLGNSMSILNAKTKVWPSCIILMQLVWTARNRDIELGMRHEHRERNRWADQLAAGVGKACSEERRRFPTMDASKWGLLGPLTSQEILESVRRKEKRKR